VALRAEFRTPHSARVSAAFRVAPVAFRERSGGSRRSFLRTAGGLAIGALALPGMEPLFAAPGARGFKIGACDWSLGRMADIGAFDRAREIGLDGVQVSLGTEANDMSLRTAGVQDKYREAARRTGVEIASLAIGELNNVPFKSDLRTVEWVKGSIDAAKALNRDVVLLAFFFKGDLKGDVEGTNEVVRRLKAIAPQAEKAGVILGIESWLSAEEHMDIIDRVGSRAVQVYYDVANSEKMGYDIYDEIRWLGKKDVICEFHMKENGALLGKGRVDFKRVRDAIEAIGYTGWLQIEGAVPPGGEIIPSYIENRRLLKSLFPA
jgi:sugar phosphate isomerase/epimerase